ncbi:MAG: hypothetical protein E6J80_01885 [Deltaproteobacteria bacterium]|nr:MAG: hypothetical protein E6J80_01885 [Deltaproteobacteria bacterium]
MWGKKSRRAKSLSKPAPCDCRCPPPKNRLMPGHWQVPPRCYGSCPRKSSLCPRQRQLLEPLLLRAAPQTSVLRPVSAPVGKKPAAPAGRWSVQVQTTTQQEVAQNVARLLREQGHTPLVNKVVRQGEVWYRVRVGTFTNQEEARAAAARFRREGKFAQAYLVSE